MIDFISKRKYYYLASGALLIISIVALAIFGLNFSIDFAGGSEFIFNSQKDVAKIEKVFKTENIEIHSTAVTNDGITLRTAEVDQATRERLDKSLAKNADTKIEEFQSIGPVIGNETQSKAIQAVILATIAILIYIAITFRKVSRPVASWKYGTVAVAALIHDVLITIGAFAIFGVLWNVEVDPLFITAILTIMGFSVHDTIVTFDRVRENLKNNAKNTPFPTVVNNSIVETITRSVNTSMTVLFVLVALLLFGGESIRWFTVALIIGVSVGVYSSVFIASQLLVTWYEWDKKKNQSKKQR